MSEILFFLIYHKNSHYIIKQYTVVEKQDFIFRKGLKFCNFRKLQTFLMHPKYFAGSRKRMLLYFSVLNVISNVIPFTKSLAVDVRLPALNMTVPESSVARFFNVSVWIWLSYTPISLNGLFSSKVPSSHHCTLPGACPESWQEKVAHSPTKTSVVVRPEIMKTSFTVE